MIGFKSFRLTNIVVRNLSVNFIQSGQVLSYTSTKLSYFTGMQLKSLTSVHSDA